MSTKYLANRLKYHTASRVGAKETDPLLNALNKDQHTVHYSNVWTSPNNATKNDFPVNADNNAENSVGYNRNLPTDYNFKTNTDSTYATDNLIAIFKSGATSINFKNGKIWSNTAYPAVKLYEAVDMTPVTGSNGSGIYYEAYEVLDENNIRLIDWVSPMAVSDPVINKPIPGYAGKLELNVKGTSNWVEVYKTDKSTASGVQGSVWDASYGNWEFVYSAGLAIFNADYTPTRYASYFSTYNNGTAVKDVVKLRWTGFLYTGTYSDKKQDIVEANITTANITTANIDTDNVTSLGVSGTATINDADITTGDITTLTAGTATITTANITTGGITTLTANTASITSATIGTENVTSSTIETATIGTENVTSSTIETATITTGTVTDLTVTHNATVDNDLTVSHNESVVGVLTVDGLDVKKSIVNMFAGATLPDSTNLDSYYTTGISRITNNIKGVKPSISSVAGFLQVMDIDHDDDTTSMKSYRRLRQIIYPDNADESTPYTRVGELDSLTGTVSWFEWNQMGGGSLRRVVVDGTTTAKTINPTQNNVMYESFGANTFILPLASSVPVGTRVGIEQYINNGVVRVVNGSTIVYEQIIAPSSTYILTSDTTFQSNKAYFTFNGIEYVRATISIGSAVATNTYYELKQTEPTSYLFECVLNQDNSTREWVLDAEHNHGNMLTIMNARINNIGSDISAEVARATTRENDLEAMITANDALENTLRARTVKYYPIGDNDSTSRTIVNTAPTANTTAARQTAANISYNLYYYDIYFTYKTTNTLTIILPNTAPDCSKVSIELVAGSTVRHVTVRTSNNSVSETFDGDTSSSILLEFMYTSAFGWRLLSLA